MGSSAGPVRGAPDGYAPLSRSLVPISFASLFYIMRLAEYAVRMHISVFAQLQFFYFFALLVYFLVG